MTSSRRRTVMLDRGQVTPMTAILVVSILALSGLVLDGGRLFAARREATATASAAALAGAQAVDVGELRRSRTRLDPSAASAAAHDYLAAAGFDGSVRVTEDEVSVTVTITAEPVLLSLIGLGEREVQGDGAARIERGL